MSRLTRDGTAEPVSRDHIVRRERGQGNIIFPCSADHEEDWQSYPVDPFCSILSDDPPPVPSTCPLHPFEYCSECGKIEAHIVGPCMAMQK